MKTLDELAENPARAEIIRKVVRETLNLGQPMTAANVGLEIGVALGKDAPSFGELEQVELDAAIAELAEAEGAAEAAAFNKHRQRHRAPLVPPPVEEVVAPAQGYDALSDDELLALGREVEDRLHLARGVVEDRTQDQKIARAAVADAIRVWQTGGVVVTHEMIARQAIAVSNAERAKTARSAGAPPFVQRRMTTGNHRGSVSLTQLSAMRAQARAKGK